MSSESSENEEVIVVYRRQRIFRPRTEFDTFENTYEYNERFRLSFQKFQMVLENIVPFLQHETARNHALTPKQQLQIALHWLGTGAQFHAIADMHGVSKSSVCRAIQNVVHGINNNLFHVLVQWPNNVYEIIQKFSDRSGMPLVCGAIDGTLIKIDAPSAHEPAFVDRNGKHSLNVMLVCGPDCTFYFCNANWPGSVNDARVLRRSSLYTRMEQGWRPAPDAVLIGDSIYPLRSWLIPPLLRNPEDPAQLRFVRAHKKTRWIIESAIGILKEKFPCLNYLRVKPAYACNIIKACVTLCNLTKHEAVNYDDEDFRDDGNEMREEVEDNDAGNQKLQFFYNHFNSKYFFVIYYNMEL